MCSSDLKGPMSLLVNRLSASASEIFAGYYYALNDGEPEDVALALNEQYMPRGAGTVRALRQEPDAQPAAG